jgi:hypothetical protein
MVMVIERLLPGDIIGCGGRRVTAIRWWHRSTRSHRSIAAKGRGPTFADGDASEGNRRVAALVRLTQTDHGAWQVVLTTHTEDGTRSRSFEAESGRRPRLEPLTPLTYDTRSVDLIVIDRDRGLCVHGRDIAA